MQRLAAGQIIRGRYVLETMLGRGGMGSVWRARDRRLGRNVAVKFMAARLQGSPIAKKRFEREASISSKLQSRHVVRVHDHGVEEATPFIVMELLEGEDLAARLQRLGRLPPGDATRIVVDVCRGLRRAHEAGLVHRDLKPANVFLAREEDGTETAKILDFGVVKTTLSTFEASVATESGAIVGSVQYASPEQAEGARDLDARSDLWSVAALAFRVLTGRLPFPGEALGTVVLAICSKPLPVATEIAPDLPEPLDAFFERAFQRDRAARFQTALELSDALVAAVHGVQPASSPIRGSQPSGLDAFDDGGASTIVAGPSGSATRVIDLAEAARRSVLDDDDEARSDDGLGDDGLEEPTRAIVAGGALEPAEGVTRKLEIGGDGERSSAGALVAPIEAGPLGRRRRIARATAAAAALLVTAVALVSWLAADETPRAASAGRAETEATVPSTVATPVTSTSDVADLPTAAATIAVSAAPAPSTSASASPALAPPAPPRRAPPARRTPTGCKDGRGRAVPCPSLYTPSAP